MKTHKDPVTLKCINIGGSKFSITVERDTPIKEVYDQMREQAENELKNPAMSQQATEAYRLVQSGDYRMVINRQDTLFDERKLNEVLPKDVQEITAHLVMTRPRLENHYAEMMKEVKEDGRFDFHYAIATEEAYNRLQKDINSDEMGNITSICVRPPDGFLPFEIIMTLLQKATRLSEFKLEGQEHLTRSQMNQILQVLQTRPLASLSLTGFSHTEKDLSKNEKSNDGALKAESEDKKEDYNPISHNMGAIARIMKLPTFQHLDLADNNLGANPASLHFIAGTLKHSSLLSLNLARNGLDSKAMSPVTDRLAKEKTHLLRLNVSENKLKKEGAEKIAEVMKATHLEVLDISRNSITDEGVIAIAIAAMEEDSHLCSLDVSDGTIKNQGAAKLSEALQVKDSKLASLYLNDNKMDKEGVQKFLEGLKHNHSLTTLHLKVNYDSEPGLVAAAKSGNFPNATLLNFVSSTFYLPAGVQEKLKRNQKLQAGAGAAAILTAAERTPGVLGGSVGSLVNQMLGAADINTNSLNKADFNKKFTQSKFFKTISNEESSAKNSQDPPKQAPPGPGQKKKDGE